jgi:hypothetical protein
VPDGPLSVLAGRLRRLAVPSLSSLIAQLEGAEEYQEFAALVRELLPERELDILGMSTPEEQIAAFAQFFEDRYFPLDDSFKYGDVESYTDLTRGIPIVPLGLSYDDYHEITWDWREGYQLMTYLVQSPYDDVRASLAEACAEHVPEELLRQVPEEGFSPGELHRLLDESPYRGLALWADIVWGNTGNVFLDTDLELLWQEGFPPWDRETVENLTREWQQAEVIQREVFDLAEWLEQDPAERFGELLNFILERR